MRARTSDKSADLIALVAVEIVHNDDIAWRQRRQEHLLDVGRKGQPVNWAVKHEWGGQTVNPQGRNQRQGFPVPMGYAADQGHALLAPTSQARHVCLDPCLVNKGQACRLDAGLIFPPPIAPSGDIRPVLLGGAQRFF